MRARREYAESFAGADIAAGWMAEGGKRGERIPAGIAATANAVVVEARGLRFAGGGGSRAKPRVARAARSSYPLALAPPVGRGCCHGYSARALTLTNGWPRVS